jgi:hypothetical protein
MDNPWKFYSLHGSCGSWYIVQLLHEKIMGAKITLEEIYNSDEHQKVAKACIALLDPANKPTPEVAATALQNYVSWFKAAPFTVTHGGAVGIPKNVKARIVVADKLSKVNKRQSGEELWVALRDYEHFNGEKENMDKFAVFHCAYCDLGDEFEALARTLSTIAYSGDMKKLNSLDAVGAFQSKQGFKPI